MKEQLVTGRVKQGRGLMLHKIITGIVTCQYPFNISSWSKSAIIFKMLFLSILTKHVFCRVKDGWVGFEQGKVQKTGKGEKISFKNYWMLPGSNVHKKPLLENLKNYKGEKWLKISLFLIKAYWNL